MTIFKTEKTPEWASDDAKILKDFLASSVGVRAFQHVMTERPALMDGADVNRTLVRNGEVKGFDLAVDSLFRLTHEQPVPERAPTEYPDLDDEGAWTPENTPK